MKISKKTLSYGIFFAVTLVTFSSLVVWANSNQSELEVQIQKTEVKISSNTRQEYLLNEEIDLTGVQLKVNDKYIDASQCKVDYDFSSSGDKAVSVSYVEENINYQGYYQVKALMIRHLDIRNKDIRQNSDGTWDTSSLVVWAELNAPAVEFKKPIEYPKADDTVIILEPHQYKFEVVSEEREGYYTGHVKVGYLNNSFSFITNTTDPKVDSIERILSFTNASDTLDKLTLFVTKSSNNFVAPNGQSKIDVEGIYVLVDPTGNKKQYRFSYSLDGWTSNFNSSSFNEGLVDQQGYNGNNDDYRVEVNGLTFYAVGVAWRKAILGM